MQGRVGYRLLARKYGLKRDTVRYWVLANKVHMKTEDKIETEEKDIADFEIINSMPEFERTSYRNNGSLEYTIFVGYFEVGKCGIDE